MAPGGGSLRNRWMIEGLYCRALYASVNSLVHRMEY